MRGQIGSYAYMQIWSYSWKLFHHSRKVKKYPKRHIYTIQQNQNLIKKFQYYGSSLKNPIFYLFFLGGGGEVCMKCFFRGGVKKGAWIVSNLTGDLAKEGAMFLKWGGVEIPMDTMSWRSLFIDTNIQSK